MNHFGHTRGTFDLGATTDLARTLSDAVLVLEVGPDEPAARVGFQVHFVERDIGHVAFGGIVLADPEPADVMLFDVAMMDADWSRQTRAEVIDRIVAAMTETCELPSRHLRGG